MSMIFLFLVIFFGIFGAVKAVKIMYTSMVRRITYAIYKKIEKDVKIWIP